MERLADLGFDSYADYLRSPHWRERRRLAGNAAKWTCACGARATAIHHRSYRHLGEERDADLCAVCDPCHVEIHERRDEGMSLAAATDAVLKGRKRKAKRAEPLRGAWHPGRPLRGDVVVPEPKKKKPKTRKKRKPVLTKAQQISNDRIRDEWRRQKKSKKEPKTTAECPPARD